MKPDRELETRITDLEERLEETAKWLASAVCHLMDGPAAHHLMADDIKTALEWAYSPNRRSG